MQELDLELAKKIVDYLNELLKIDRPVIAAFITNRIPCSKKLANHPTVQAAAQHGGFYVGFLGLLNGLCGIHENGVGPICFMFKPEDGNNMMMLDRFLLTSELEDKNDVK